MLKSFTTDALAIATTAKALAEELHYTKAGREHLLLTFASGAGGDLIRSAFERCGLTAAAVRSAIKPIDSSDRPVRHHHVKYVHQLQEEDQPYVEGLMALIENQLFSYLTSNADQVFKMARNECVENDVAVEDVLRIFLRELGRSDDDSPVLQVIKQAAPKLTLGDIKSAVVESLDVEIARLEDIHGKVIVVDSSTLTEPQQAIIRLKRVRHDFMYTGQMQRA
ncbi:MAG: hypothetical protein JWN26_599 [Candidatus Saccharibacteria bacterium]|nr:hypothetical protein [Candidatus Saccharibacteria bacterium]